jgi:hypothetical protein
MERKLFYTITIFVLILIVVAVSYRIKENRRLSRDCYESTLGYICLEDFKPDSQQCIFSCRSVSTNWNEFKSCAINCQKVEK